MDPPHHPCSGANIRRHCKLWGHIVLSNGHSPNVECSKTPSYKWSPKYADEYLRWLQVVKYVWAHQDIESADINWAIAKHLEKIARRRVGIQSDSWILERWAQTDVFKNNSSKVESKGTVEYNRGLKSGHTEIKPIYSSIVTGIKSPLAYGPLWWNRNWLPVLLSGETNNGPVQQPSNLAKQRVAVKPSVLCF